MSEGNSSINVITIPDGYIIHHTTTGTSWEISDNAALLEILRHHSIYFGVVKRKNKRNDAQLAIYSKEREIERPYLSRVAYDCYYNGLSLNGIADYYSERQTDQSNSPAYPTIDHLDGCSFNDRKENIFEMTREENKRKYQLPQKIKGNRCITLANDSGRCKIQFAYTDYKGHIRVLRFICWDSQSINACLNYLYTNRYRIASERQGELLEDQSDYKIDFMRLPFLRVAYKMQPINSRVLAAKLANMPDGVFSPVTAI